MFKLGNSRVSSHELRATSREQDLIARSPRLEARGCIHFYLLTFIFYLVIVGVVVNLRNYGLEKSANIKAFVVHGEIVSVTQGVLGLRAEGHIHKLPARYIPFVPFAPPQVRAATAVINLGLSGYNHTMHSVMSKMGIK